MVKLGLGPKGHLGSVKLFLSNIPYSRTNNYGNAKISNTQQGKIYSAWYLIKYYRYAKKQDNMSHAEGERNQLIETIQEKIHTVDLVEKVIKRVL